MTDSPASSEPCQHRELIEALSRQSAAMERLAELLPQIVAQNQVFIRLLLERDDSDEPSTYLDGTPIRANRAAGS